MILRQFLLQSAAIDAARPGLLNEYGQRYEIDSEMRGPAATATVRSVWTVPTGQTVPRLVTCYVLE